MNSDFNIDFQSVREGNTDAFRLLFEIYYPRIRAFACRFVEESAADDLTQDVFTQIWNQRASINPENIGSYLYRATQNHCLNHLKHAAVVSNHHARISLAIQRAQYYEAQYDAESTSNAWKYVQNRNLRELIEQAIDKLPPKCAEAFRLSYLEHKSNQEVAEEMAISVRTVETHICKALSILRVELKGLFSLILCSLL